MQKTVNQTEKQRAEKAELAECQGAILDVAEKLNISPQEVVNYIYRTIEQEKQDGRSKG